MKALSARLPAEVILSHLSELPPSYIARTPADVIGDHILLFIRAEGRTAVEHTRRGDSDEITIVASDRPGILSGLAGTLATHGVSILGGAIHTRESGHALDVLSVRRLETAASSWEDLCAYFTPATKGRPEIHGGFALGHWAGGVEDEKRLKDELKVTVRCIPDDPSLRGGPGICIVTGKPAEGRVVFAKSY